MKISCVSDENILPEDEQTWFDFLNRFSSFDAFSDD